VERESNRRGNVVMCAAASWSAVAEMPGPPGIGDTALAGPKNGDLREDAVGELRKVVGCFESVAPAKAVSPTAPGVSATALHDASRTEMPLNSPPK